MLVTSRMLTIHVLETQNDTNRCPACCSLRRPRYLPPPTNVELFGVPFGVPVGYLSFARPFGLPSAPDDGQREGI